MALEYPYQEWPPEILMAYIAVQVITIAFLIMISSLFWLKFREKRSFELKMLGTLTVCMAISFVIGIVPQVLALTAHDLPIINGIPVFFEGRRLWWTNLAYVFLSVSNLCLFKFNQSIFQKPPRIVFWIYLALIVVFNIWSFYHGIFEVVPGVPSLTLPLSILFLGLQFYVWGFLFFKAFHGYRRLSPSMYKVGLQMIALSALCMILSFITYAVNVLLKTQVITILNFAFYIFTSFLIYLGDILPKWFRRLLAQKYPDEATK
ncbi:MAG: hypothetical protein JW839_22105 [Candidatus Lokiarchaeota archaeon]|nr:hypothetical protein [Candidatus Lokiarchaeota archaeon]